MKKAISEKGNYIPKFVVEKIRELHSKGMNNADICTELELTMVTVEKALESGK